MATTQNGIYYPDNYNAVADVPKDMKDMAESIDDIVNNKEDKSNKVTTLSNTSTDTQYPSAKCVYDSQEAQNTNIQANTDTIQNLENILPKATATGENITVNNSADYKFNYFNNGGNTFQQSYEGYNLFNYAGYSSLSSGVFVTYDKEFVTIKNTNNSQKTISFLYNPNLEAGTYKMQANVKNISLPDISAKIVVYIRSTQGEYGDALQLTTTGEKSFTKTSANPISNVVIALPANCEITTSLQLVNGSTSKDYEPYVGKIPAPNPDYPQDIISVGDNINLFDKDNATSGYYYTNTGIISTSLDWYIEQVPVQANKNYYLSGNNNNNTTAHIVLLDQNKDLISVVGNYKNVKLITTTNTTAYIGLSIADYNNTADMNTLKLEQGSIATGYTPYNRGGIDVKVSNKNLFSDTLEVGSIDSSGNNSSSSVNIRNVNYVKVQPNTNYVISINGYTNNIGLRYYDKNKIFISSQSSSASPRNFTTPENCYYMRFVVVSTTDTTLKVQIEKGSTESSYIAHTEQNITVPLPTGMELCKIGDYSDKIFHNIPTNPMYNARLIKGGWYKYNAISEHTLVDTDNITYDGDTIFYTNSISNLLSIDTIIIMVSNHFRGVSYNNRTSSGNNIIYFHNGIVYIRYTSFTSLNEFNTFLQQNEVKLQYILATPTYTQITDTDTLEALYTLESTKTYQGVTNISSIDNPSPIFDIQYFLDLQNLFN